MRTPSETETTFSENLSGTLDQLEQVILQKNVNHKEPDARKMYKFLGENKMLTPSWPSCYGGLELPYRTNGLVAEQMVLRNIPESLYILSIHFAGGILLLSGTEEQKKRFLPPLANGDIFFSILYTEEHAGSDLANLSTQAIAADEENYRLTGTKVYSLKSMQADYALCAARTNMEGSKYQGITIFIVPMNAEGITIQQLPTISDEQFCRVILKNVLVSKKNILGEINEGWSVITKAISLERTGLDFLIKAIKSHHYVAKCLSRVAIDEGHSKEFKLLSQRLSNAKNFVYNLLDYFEVHKKINELDASIAKLTCSELSVAIIYFAYNHLNLMEILNTNENIYPILDSAFREAPGLTLSAGTSEMMLEAIANHMLTLN